MVYESVPALRLWLNETIRPKGATLVKVIKGRQSHAIVSAVSKYLDTPEISVSSVLFIDGDICRWSGR